MDLLEPQFLHFCFPILSRGFWASYPWNCCKRCC